MSIKTVSTLATELEKGQFLRILNKHYYKVAKVPIAAMEATDDHGAIHEEEGSARLIKNISNSTQRNMVLRSEANYDVCDVDNVEQLYARTRAKPRITRGMVTSAMNIDRTARQVENEATVTQEAIDFEKAQEAKLGGKYDTANAAGLNTTSGSGIDTTVDTPTSSAQVEEGQATSILSKLTNK